MDVMRTAWAALVMAAACVLSGCARGPHPLNVLLVTLDTTRADHLHCYGYRNIETLHLDALAREGIVFDHAVAAAPLTMPAHTSIMTGLTPMAHGVRDNGTYRLGDGANTMATILKARGYETAAVVGAYVLDHQFGLAQGFDHYDDQIAGGNLYDSFHILERTADRVSDAAIQWLDGRKSKRRPFFLWVHYFDAHAEYTPPSPYREQYAASPYDGEIAFVDGQLGRLLEEIQRLDLWKHTLVIVVGDHGESLGEHGEPTHGLLVYGATLHVPLIMSHPDGRLDTPAARWKPRHVPALVQQIDILPTVAATLGIALPAPVEGRSLLPLLDGAEMKRHPAYSETLEPLLVYGWAPLRSLSTATMHFILAPRPELYDLEHDPAELHDLAAERPGVVADFQQQLAWYAARAESCAIKVGHTQLNQQEQQKLASLGYIQGGAAAPSREFDPADLAHHDPKDMIGAFRDDFQSGKTALDAGDAEEAETLLHAFVAADPDCGEGHFFLGLALRSEGKLDAALKELDTAAGLAPHDFKIPLHQGIVLTMMNRHDDARAAYEKALALSPADADVLLSLGSLDEAAGHPDSALARYDRVIQLEPANALGHLSRGVVLRKLGRDKEAAAELGRAATLVPRNPAYLQAFGRTLGEMGHPELARPLFEELARSDPRDAVVHASLGNCYLLAGDDEKAAAEYSQAVALAPGEAQYEYLLGCAYGGMRDYERARAAWQRTLELNPQHAEARHNLQILAGGAGQ